MITIKGTYNTAVCYTNKLEDTAKAQIQSVCDAKAFADSKIRIMPDVHAGVGCTVGTTMTIGDKVVPGMVGVDIGCGMETVQVEARNLDYGQLDSIIHKNIPSGFNIRSKPHRLAGGLELEELRCAEHVNLNRAEMSIGTLGGGNHFIEVDRGEDGSFYLVVHSGSRNLGSQVAEYYQKAGFEELRAAVLSRKEDAGGELTTTKKAKSGKKGKKSVDIGIPRDLAYVSGKLFEDYIHDMKIVQAFAALNRKAMVDTILTGMRLRSVSAFTTIHNYIDTDSMILRKGAVSAREGEKLLIPINMRDGSLVCVGRGNEDWNYSAPHGAGRLMSRSAAFQSLSMDAFRSQMEGIYSTSVSRETLDESPMAYKSMDEIASHLGATAEIVENIKPVYNFKAAEASKNKKRR